MQGAGLLAAGRGSLPVVMPGLLGRRLRRSPCWIRFSHVLHGPHHLLPVGVEVDLRVPGEQRLELFTLIAIALARMPLA